MQLQRLIRRQVFKGHRGLLRNGVRWCKTFAIDRLAGHVNILYPDVRARIGDADLAHIPL